MRGGISGEPVGSRRPYCTFFPGSLVDEDDDTGNAWGSMLDILNASQRIFLSLL